MADRSAKPEGSEEPRDIVELDKDDRWQARLAEARARREIALREKKASRTPKRRRKPWEEEPGDDPDEVIIEPLIQDRPPGDDRLDFADRLEVIREAESDSDVPPRKSATPALTPVTEDEPRRETPSGADHGTSAAKPPRPEVMSRPKIKPRTAEPAREAREIPKIEPARKTHDAVQPDAPDVIDLAQRYAATLKPPVNVTVPFDTVPPPEPVEPFNTVPEPAPAPSVAAAFRSRRPIGLAVIVLAFSLIPLAETAPPLEKGPPLQPVPFFGLPPALGLTTSLVWLPEPTGARDQFFNPEFAPPLDGLSVPEPGPLGTGWDARSFQAPDLSGPGPAVAWDQIVGTVQAPGPGPLEATPSPEAPDRDIPAPLPRPEAPDPRSDIATPEASDARSLAPVRRIAPIVSPDAPEGIEQSLLVEAAPLFLPDDSAPQQVEVLTAPLKLTILVPSDAGLQAAEQIAEDVLARGHVLTRVQTVDMRISERNIRYFHAADRTEAARLAEAYGAELKDFTWFQPKPEPGTTELWLSGRGSAAASGNPGGSDGRAISPEATAQASEIVVVRRRPSFIEWLFTGETGGIQIILPDGLVEGSGTASPDN